MHKLVKNMKGDHPSFPSVLPPSRPVISSTREECPLTENSKAEELFDRQEKLRKENRIKTALLQVEKKKLEKLLRRQKKISDDLNSLERKQVFLSFGELMKQHMSHIKKGMKSVCLKDYTEGRDVVIDLDPALGPVENMNRYFNQYKKALRGKDKSRQVLEKTEKDIALVQKEINNLITALPENLVGRGEEVASEKRAPKKQEVSRPHQFVSFDNLSLLVGKKSTQNDDLTFKYAQGNDLWFHVRGGGGAHVLLQTEKRKEIPQESILDGATLALLYSKFKNEGRGEVIYTYKKYVKKPKGAKPGMVSYSQEKNIFITIDPSRVERLTASKK